MAEAILVKFVDKTSTIPAELHDPCGGQEVSASLFRELDVLQQYSFVHSIAGHLQWQEIFREDTAFTKQVSTVHALAFWP
jgi:hypothetical protein